MPKGALALRPGRVTLVFHEPLPTRGLRQEDREELMRRCQEAIASALNSG